MNKIPWTVRQMVAQLGAGFRGAVCYTGGRDMAYACPHEPDGEDREHRPDTHSSVTPEGFIAAEVCLYWRVNAKGLVKIHISYEPDDTYTVRLWKATRMVGKVGEVVDESGDVYCDNLKEACERMYDRYIKTHQGGFIDV